MERGEQRPNGEQFAEASAPEQSGVNPFDALVEQTRLNVPDIDEYSDMWKGLDALAISSPRANDIAAEERIPVTPELRHMIGQISTGIDFVLFEAVSPTKRGQILRELAELQQTEGIHELILTYEEGVILQKAAAAVNVAYDPGTPEEVEKRTFKIADLEAKAQGLDVVMPYWSTFKPEQ
jgi:hypothetical protein